MPAFRTATITALLSERPGIQRVETDAGRAYALTQLVGPVREGDRVVLNTTAVDLGLGTGGWHVVHWNLARDEWSEPGPGHIMKLRYTSLQVDSGAAEEQHPEVSSDLRRMPVVACALHSQLAPVTVALLATAPSARVVYVMTDGAALPLPLSDLVAQLVDGGLVAATITAGHAFGGDLEAVSVPSALALARNVLSADVAVVAMGPGVVGTGSELGTTAVEVAAILDATEALGGIPVVAARMSSGDGRERHQGLSHHTATALRLVRSRVTVPIPAGQVVGLEGHDVHPLPAPPIVHLLADAGVEVTTMGRTPEQDPLFFEAAAVAGVAAGAFLASPGPG